MLKIHNLEFRYQFRRILQGVSFAAEAGEIVHIIGPNGAGKTTLMTILAGLRREHAGRIEYESKPGQVADDRRDFIEYLPAEANALYGKMDAMTNLRFWQSLRGLKSTDEALVNELELWDLDHPLIRQNFPVERYSTGMKRRLALARVKLSETPCWLLDEPLYGLDTKGIQTFQAMLQGHLQKGGQAWIVSHDTAPLSIFKLRTLDLGGKKS
ncbi:MAG TPA: heme ABC exporter ATP-binding protein CcmA [Oligoflexus sp.]|uniref:heme ABC exporter ATP-binding protein CcmA n=1 Tax=Oligoflexus sp. TaxID=1971216 RepID=UPI002D2DF239|nr:heme ABC exporter ATP-binding protein CcmA [Oligoflexus sp.]HYX33330.1 heme ABC exporter ATP-binding protein CcmA [Oligoflexus sp.]